MEMRTSATRWRSKKSSITACQIGPKPTAAVRTSMRQAPPRSVGSTSTSRLPEPTTPTRVAGGAAAIGWPPRYSNVRDSMGFGLAWSPVAETLGRVVKAARRAYQILDRPCGQQVAGRQSLVDAQVLGAADHAAVAQVLNQPLVASEPNRRVAGDAADR